MKDWIIEVLCTLAVLVVVALAYHFGPPRTLGRAWVPHAITAGCLILIEVLLPVSIAKYIFSALTATVVGTVFPIYESVRAVCTPQEDDDKAWLQYWMVGGVLFMCTEWVGHAIGDDNEKVVYWYEFMSVFFVWLFLPVTDGAALIYYNITEPFLAPKVKPLQAKMNNAITALYQTMINAVHLWLLWIIFLFLPQGLKRIIAVAVGTVYPEVSSIAAAATEEVADDTYWLTYWSVYGCLFLIMELLETWLGRVPGFYTLIILTTVYLMLPMFTGADKLFRKVLVPLSGLQEMLMLRDAIQVKKQMLRDLDPERAKAVRQAIAKFYSDDDAVTVDPVDLPATMKTEYLMSWQSIKVSNPFGGQSQEGVEPDETTPMV